MDLLLTVFFCLTVSTIGFVLMLSLIYGQALDNYMSCVYVLFRFSQPSSTSQLPLWIRPHVKKYSNFGAAIKDLMIFFKTAQQMVSEC